MVEPAQRSIENRMLAGLPRDEYERLLPHLSEVSLTLSQVLFRPNDNIDHAYFPTSSIVSLLTDLSDGSGMEVGLVGREGLVGVSVILGGPETKVATVQAAGRAQRIKAEILLKEFRRGGALHDVLLRYLHALMTQISQTVVCSVRHTVEGRLARWLLMFHDRVERDEFSLTHEFLAAMLGVRRAGISEAAMKLQNRNLIRYERGHFAIVDRKGLEEFACECYPVVKAKYDSLL